jgi:endonuclease/exonuclease/phosphatase family metal-dependent hydrolase
MNPQRVLFLAIAIFSALQPSLFADEKLSKLTIATWNLEWFFDQYTGDNSADLAKKQAAPSRPDWDWKLAGVAKVIGEIKPDILALQEVENRRVLFYLNQRLKSEYGLNYRIAFVEGEDFFTEQDVAIMALSGLTGYGRKERTKEQVEEHKQAKDKKYYNLTKHIVADFAWGAGVEQEQLTIINLHTRAMSNGAEIRQRQARLVREWMKDQCGSERNFIIIGDLNSDEMATATTPNGDMGIFLGLSTPASDDDLFDTHLKLSGDVRASHLNGMQYDRILCSDALMKDDPSRSELVFKSSVIRRDLVLRGKEQDKDHMDIFWQIPADERDISDHYPLVAEFEVK